MITTYLMVAFLYVLYAAGAYKMFEKMGEPGIKGLIPLYNVYTLYSHVWETLWFWAWLIFEIGDVGITALGSANSTLTTISGLLAIAVLIVKVICASRTAKAFGKGLITCLILAFFPFIGTLILGFGKSEYQGS